MGCTDVNGGPDTNGDAGCEKLPYFCDAAVGNLCQPESCGSARGTPSTEANAFCAVSGCGGLGWCAPPPHRSE